MQMSIGEAEYAGKRKQTRREKFLSEMEPTIPWDYLAKRIETHDPQQDKRGRQPYRLETMLRIHFMQQWFNLSDPAMEEALYDIASMRQFAGLSLTQGSIPDETTILNFRHLLEAHGIAEEIFEGVRLFLQDQGLFVRQGTMVDATIIDAPSSTKNVSGERDPEMHQIKKGNQWRLGMKAHIGVDLHTGLVHSVHGTSANEADVAQTHHLLHGGEQRVSNDGFSNLTFRQRHSVVALMLTCGMYNAAGDHAARVGLPMKSGIGGGIVALIPGVGSLCAWSPGLDKVGNSLAADQAIELFVQHTGTSILGSRRL